MSTRNKIDGPRRKVARITKRQRAALLSAVAKQLDDQESFMRATLEEVQDVLYRCNRDILMLIIRQVFDSAGEQP